MWNDVEVVVVDGPIEALLMWIICQFVFSLENKGTKTTVRFLAFNVLAAKDVNVLWNHQRISGCDGDGRWLSWRGSGD